MNASMGVRIQGSLVGGAVGRDSGFSDHQTAAFSLPAGTSLPAPCEIQWRIRLMSSLLSGGPDMGMRGGSPLIIFTIKLSSGFPGTRIAPCLPPLRRSG